MTGSDMFSEFISILISIFNMLWVSKYHWLFIAVFVSFAGSIVLFIVRWLNRA